MPRTPIHSDHAPAAIGPYSQATRAGNLVFLSGQIPLDPATGNLVTQEYRVEGPVMLFLTTTAIDIDEELLNRCLVLTINESAPYPARSTIEVPALPKGAVFEVDAMMVLP